MIVGNGVRLTGNPNRSLAAPLSNTTVRSGWNRRGALLNIYTNTNASKKDGIPSGLRHPSVWVLPIKPGGLSSRNIIEGDGAATGNLAGGINTDAALAGLGEITTADAVIIAALTAALEGVGIISQADITAIVIAGIEAALAGTSAVVTADITALLYTAATLAGGSTVPTALLDALGLPTATVTGEGSVTVTGRADGSMDADISLGATLELSPDTIASSVKSALMDTELDGYTVEDIIKLTSSVLLGKSSGGATSPVFRSLNDTATRVSGEVDAFGNRTDSVLSP
jgi:hypothetical protein